MSAAGKRLLDAAKEMRAIARGEAKPAHMLIPPDVDVKAIRRSLGMSQDAFAAEFCFSINQIRDWEQNRKRPLDANRAYLMLIQTHPEEIRRALQEVRRNLVASNPQPKLAANG